MEEPDAVEECRETPSSRHCVATALMDSQELQSPAQELHKVKIPMQAEESLRRPHLYLRSYWQSMDAGGREIIFFSVIATGKLL